MKNTVNAIVNELIPSLTENLSVAAKTVKDGTTTFLQPGAGLINKSNTQISQNPQAFGFAFEHLQAIGFNINVVLKKLDSCADQIPVDKTTKFCSDIYIEKAGQFIAEIQAKTGSTLYLEKQVGSGHYQGKILTNAETKGIPETEIIIDIDGIQSFPVSQTVAQWIAQNPYLSAELICAVATVGEVSGAGIKAGIINAEINILLQSIKIIGFYCRGEQNLTDAELYNLLQVTVDSLKNGFIRVAAIKVIQKLMNGHAFAALGFTVSAEVIPILIQVMQDEITIERAILKVGSRALTAGLITTSTLLFPPIGIALLDGAVMQTIWQEISPEWQKFIVKTGQTMVTATQVGMQAGNQHLQKHPWDRRDLVNYSTPLEGC